MGNWLFATDSQTNENLQNELLTSTTRKLGNSLLHEYQASSRRQKGIKEELSRRIRLMQKIPESHPREIFVYNDKGFKSFTPEVEDILTRDLLRKPQKIAVPKYLDYTRDMLKNETEKEKKAQPTLKEGAKGHQEGDDQLKEDYEQLVEEFGAMETEHQQLIEKYKQLKKDHVQLQKEHEQVLHELSGRKVMQTKAPEQTDSAPDMRPRDEGPKRPQALGDKTLPPEIQRQARGAQEAQEARQRASAQARGIEAREKEAREKETREKEAHDQHETKIREWEDANFMKEMKKRERELQEERAARERQRMRAPPNDLPGAERLDIQAEGSAPQAPCHSIHGGVFDSQPPPPTRIQELSQRQKIGYPNMPQYLPYQPKHASLRQANDSKSVSFDLPTKTPKKEQEPLAEQRSESLQQRIPSKSVSTGLPTGTSTMGQILPAQHPPAKQPPTQQSALLQPPVRQPPAQHPPVQQFPTQQRSAGLQQAYDPRSFPYGLPTGTPDMGHLLPARQKSAPLQQTDESKNESFCLHTRTASMPTDLRAPTLSSETDPELGIPPRRQERPRSQEPPQGENFDQDRAAERIDGQRFIRLLDPS